jgi:sulfur carrier protein ThiS
MRIYLGGHLNFYHPQKENWLEIELVAPPVRLKDVLLDAGIPLGEVYLVVVNGEAVDLQEAIISETDAVKMFSPVGGG